MKEMDEIKFNNYTKKLFENIDFEKPPKDFTDKLMKKLEFEKSVTTVKSKPFIVNKFMLIFTLTFSLILLLSFFFQGGKGSENTNQALWDKFKLPDFNPGILSQYFHLDIEFGLIAKIVIGSVITLIFVDAASGSLIDRFIDSKAKKENQV